MQIVVKWITCLAVILAYLAGNSCCEALAQGQSSGNGAVCAKQSISVGAALAIAQKALAFGRSKGASMAIVVVDQSAIPLVVLRDDAATEQFVEGATQKAWTAVNFKDSTASVLKQVQAAKEDDAMLPYVPKALLLMGGVPLKVGDTIVGAIGAAGSPSGIMDDAVARSGEHEFVEMLQK